MQVKPTAIKRSSDSIRNQPHPASLSVHETVVYKCCTCTTTRTTPWTHTKKTFNILHFAVHISLVFVMENRDKNTTQTASTYQNHQQRHHSNPLSPLSVSLHHP
eukprot:503711_1